jgi:rRNA-processing protein FCF1
MSVFDRRPRAVLDSNVLGDLLKGGATLRDDFMRVAREGIAFHINNYVLDEICAAIVTNVLLPRDVATLLTELLDAEFPVLPYQRYLYGLAGFGGSPVGECVVHTRAMTDQYFEWRDLMAKTDRFDPALKSIASELAAQRVERRREYAVSLAPPVSWKRTGNENDVAVRFEEALPEMRRRFDLEYGVEPKPPASVRCDAHIRSFTLLSLRQWYDGKPADLTSKRQRGTMYDQCMLDGLAAPAYLITCDGRLRNRVRKSGSYQESWILSAREFLNNCLQGNVRPLAFPEDR